MLANVRNNAFFQNLISDQIMEVEAMNLIA